MEPNKSQMDKILSKTEISNKLLNSFKEYLRFQESLLSHGHQFEKTVTKFSKTSAAIYLPKRLIGKTFKVILIPVDDGYELSDMKEAKNSVPNDMNEKAADKLLKATEKELHKIQAENSPRKNLLDINPNPADVL
jgi:putative transposon-encoded protein